MDPATFELVKNFGLPLVVLIVSGWLLKNRTIVMGSELDRKVEQYDKELEYREERRKEEREARLASEARLDRLTAAVEQFTPLLKDVLTQVSRRDRS